MNSDTERLVERLIRRAETMESQEGGGMAILREAAAALSQQGRDAEQRNIVAHRLHTGEPRRKWQWMDGLPCHGTLRLAEQNGYEIEYAYSVALATQPKERES